MATNLPFLLPLLDEPDFVTGQVTTSFTEMTIAFVEEAVETGLDIFRIFDALNDVSQMRPAIDAVPETGRALAEVALYYTADLSDPREQLYTLDYYLRLAEQIVAAGAHVLAIKDMAGLLRPPAARTLVSALRSRFDLPVHLHTHDTPDGQLATLVVLRNAFLSTTRHRSSTCRSHIPSHLAVDRCGRRCPDGDRPSGTASFDLTYHNRC